jgi:polysaccharide export outer membrane protein
VLRKHYFSIMTKHLKGKRLLTLLGLSGAMLITSCVNTKKVTYFQNLSSAKRSEMESVAKFTEPIIQSDDILAISINTIDAQSSEIVNQAGTMVNSSTNSSTGSSRQPLNGYLVDKNGEVELSLIGNVKVAGLTTFQARELIRKEASKNLKSPNVTVRFANFKISVLGEVNRPSAYTVPNEKVSVLDALSLAGDLTIYGKRENILVIRDNNGTKEFGRLDLNSTDTFTNPFYYLKQNDVVYVEPNSARASTVNGATRTTIALALSALSTIVLVITRLD